MAKRKNNEDARIIDALNAALDDKIKIQQENAQVINDLRMDLEKEKVIRFLLAKLVYNYPSSVLSVTKVKNISCDHNSCQTAGWIKLKLDVHLKKI